MVCGPLHRGVPRRAAVTPGYQSESTPFVSFVTFVVKSSFSS